ncbi:unnamed protein product [Peronospora belbahrii]|uniref:Uncharacterized protein n=1 Tax=Peronospora belbahrii TaxID=622444 RepID=A0ABN8CS65_9STRA|nr:unnamed protein product [Peronospora belbahrii]
MTDLDGDDVVYASILTRVEDSELHNKMNNVLKKELNIIKRHVRYTSSSLTALRQLQAAAGHLRPNGDWLPATLETQLKSIEETNYYLDIVMDHMQMDRKRKKRKRPWTRRTMKKEDRDEILIVDEEIHSYVQRTDKVEIIEERLSSVDTVERDKSETLQDEKESHVEVLDMAGVSERPEINRAIKCERVDYAESEMDEKHVKDSKKDEVGLEMVTADEGIVGVELKMQTGRGNKELNDMRHECEKLSNRLVEMPFDATVVVKEEPVTVDDVQALPDDAGSSIRKSKIAADIVESPIEMEVNESPSEVAANLEASGLTELAVELEVPDSESDDEFSPVQEIVAKLQKAEFSTQLVRVPAAVDQLRTYLFDRKYLTIAAADGYLFAHKRITDKEINEIGYTIEKIVSVTMNLPKRLRIKLALCDLLATIEQLEFTLGKLPEFLRPAIKKLSSYFSSEMETISAENLWNLVVSILLLLLPYAFRTLPSQR